MKQNEMFGKNNRKKKKERRVRDERNKEDEWPQSKGRGRTAVEDARQTGIKKRHETLTHTQENNTNQHQPPHFGDVSRSLRGADLAKYTCPLLPRAPFRPPPFHLGLALVTWEPAHLSHPRARRHVSAAEGLLCGEPAAQPPPPPFGRRKNDGLFKEAQNTCKRGRAEL